MNKEKLNDLKNRIKNRTPEILTVAASAAAIVTYTAYVQWTNRDNVTIPLTHGAKNSYDDGSLVRHESEDEHYKYTITSKDN